MNILVPWLVPWVPNSESQATKTHTTQRRKRHSNRSTQLPPRASSFFTTMTVLSDAVEEKVRPQPSIYTLWLHKILLTLWISLQSSFFFQCKTELAATFVECQDHTDGSCDGNAKLELIVVSEQFDGVPLLKRHRQVNTALDEYMPQIHALTIKAWTPAQYETKK